MHLVGLLALTLPVPIRASKTRHSWTSKRSKTLKNLPYRTMARKSNQKSVAQAQGSSSKRRMSSAAAAGVSPKRAKRQSSSAKRASKSKFFQEEHSEDPGSTSDQDLSEEFSAFEEAESSVASAGDDEDWDDDGFDESKAHRSRQNRNHGRAKIEEPTSQKGGSKTIGKLRAKDLSRPGVKTGLGPGTQVIIKKPKARDAGDTPYSDETIHPNTMLFLKDLAANNNRQWLKSKPPPLLPQNRQNFLHEIVLLDEWIYGN